MNDTIVAISTAMGVGAISIIRVSGKDAIANVARCFTNKRFEKAPSHTVHYGHIQDKGELIDEVLITIMRAPKTYTKEDIVEINCHGGIATTEKILKLLLEKGIRLAEPGEFTKRAFLNGRIDLIESEAVMDLINGKSEEERKIAMQQLQGTTSKLIDELRDEILNVLASIEVNIDYPEYEDIEEMTNEKIRPKIQHIKSQLEEILEQSRQTQLIKRGIKTILLGRPNVGKSSLLNCMLNEEKAIVTDIAGTTRDIVEGTVILDGVILDMIDTAGIRETEDTIEKIGVKRSLKLLQEADLVIVVLSGNEPLQEADLEILSKTKNKTSIVVINKSDQPLKIDSSCLAQRECVFTNTLSIEGIKELKKKIKELFHLELLHQKDYTYLSNIRQISLAEEAYQILTEVEASLGKMIPIDMIEIDLKRSWNKLGEIIGKTYQEELIDQLFSQFCLGK